MKKFVLATTLTFIALSLIWAVQSASSAAAGPRLGFTPTFTPTITNTPTNTPIPTNTPLPPVEPTATPVGGEATPAATDTPTPTPLLPETGSNVVMLTLPAIIGAALIGGGLLLHRRHFARDK